LQQKFFDQLCFGGKRVRPARLAKTRSAQPLCAKAVLKTSDVNRPYQGPEEATRSGALDTVCAAHNTSRTTP